MVVVRDPKGRRNDDVFFSTDIHATAQAILETYAVRWSLEWAFRDSKQTLGFEHSQARAPNAVKQSGPFVCQFFRGMG